VKNRTQTFYILGAIILLAVLFLGFDTKPSTQEALEKSRSLNTREFDIQSIQSEGKQALEKDELNYIETLESQLQFANADSTRIKLLKEISGHWFQLGNPLLAGYYAKKVAELEQDATSWSIAGTTFTSALSNAEIEEPNKQIAKAQAIESFENAISLEPNVIEHRINLALCYIETPDPDQPMKGIQMLASLATSNPESALPPYHLARLALRTGQLERAEERIEQALKIDPTNAKIACLAIDIYTAANKPNEAEKWAGLCARTN
jgi:tetratricopeptide (TPR) repeat protein